MRNDSKWGDGQRRPERGRAAQRSAQHASGHAACRSGTRHALRNGLPDSIRQVKSEATSVPALSSPFGPVMLLTHSVRLSPFGPAVQLHGGAREISASSFWMRLWHELRMDAMAMAAGSGVHPPRRAEQDSTPVDGLGCRSAPNCHDGTSAATTTFAE